MAATPGIRPMYADHINRRLRGLACALVASMVPGMAIPSASAQAPAGRAGAPSGKTETAATARPAANQAKASEVPAGEAKALAATGQSIAVLVNDEPITGYEILQRQKMLGLSANIQNQVSENFKRLLQQPSTNEKLKSILNQTIEANKGKTREQIIALFEERKKQYALSLQKQAVDSARSGVLPGLKKAALDELIDERLKVQEAKRLNVLASEDDANKLVKGIAERNKMTEAQFAAHLTGLGADVGTMRSRFRANMSWNEVVRRRFGQQVAITERDVDRIVAKNPGGNEDQIELQVQRITLAVPAKLEQKAVAQRLQEAEGLRAKFAGCKSGQALAATVKEGKFEDLGARKPSAFQEPTRSLLLNAKDGEMLPPSVGQTGVELWVVCTRTVLKADAEKRTAAQDELRQKELEALAKRHLKDLRQDAHIEYR
ncbi:MAG: peptidylprolyl isomerase [Hyphomicrobium sp.]|nr:peptidylprolyl isomerase [Hyphomicrobium sp.]